MDRTSFHDSPRRSPHVTESINSPARSVHPELVMTPLDSQIDFGHRTNCFDSTTEEDSIDQAERDSHIAEYVEPPPIMSGPRHSRSRKHKSGNYLGGNTEQFHSRCGDKFGSSHWAADSYMRANPPETYGAQLSEGDRSADSSFVGSVEELTPSRPRRAHNSNIIKSRVYHRRSRSSTANEHEEDSPILGRPPVPSTKADHILGLHALTLKALERNMESVGVQGQSQISPTTFDERQSRFLSPAMRAARHRSASVPIKKVSMAPPPIDTSGPHHLPDHIVRTPYPFPQMRRKDFGQSPTAANSPPPATPSAIDSVLTLTIQRNNPHSRMRISSILVPASGNTPADFSRAVQSGSFAAKEKHFANLDFDDMEFFRQLKSHYHALLGPYRYFAARSLTRITVTGSASKAADAGYGWLHGPRSPRLLAAKGLSDTFGEDKLLRHFWKPKQGKARYAWVSWAHRLAAAPASPAAPPLPLSTPLSATSVKTITSGLQRQSFIRRADNHEGLEFVVSWSVKRILAVLLLVLSLSVAAALLWIFLGEPRSRQRLVVGASPLAGSGNSSSGYRNAGDRVGTGVVIGICVLLLGLTSMGGWIGVSWLVL